MSRTTLFLTASIRFHAVATASLLTLACGSPDDPSEGTGDGDMHGDGDMNGDGDMPGDGDMNGDGDTGSGGSAMGGAPSGGSGGTGSGGLGSGGLGSGGLGSGGLGSGGLGSGGMPLDPGVCGNGELNAGEQCDGDPPVSCADRGIGSGFAHCLGCRWDIEGCLTPHKVDVAIAAEAENGAPERLCSLDSAGVLRCVGHFEGSAPENDYYLEDVPNGSFKSIAANKNAICAQRDTGAIVCWGFSEFRQEPGEFVPEFRSPNGVDATDIVDPSTIDGEFALDDGQVMYFQDRSTNSIYLATYWEPGIFHHVPNVTSLDVQFRGSGAPMDACATYTDGDMACFSASGLPVETNIPLFQKGDAYEVFTDSSDEWTDVATFDGTRCGINENGALSCIGDDTLALPPRAIDLLGVNGELLLVRTEDGRLSVVDAPAGDLDRTGIVSAPYLPAAVELPPSASRRNGYYVSITQDDRIYMSAPGGARLGGFPAGDWADIDYGYRWGAYAIDTDGRFYTDDLTRGMALITGRRYEAIGARLFCTWTSAELHCSTDSGGLTVPSGDLKQVAFPEDPYGDSIPVCALLSDDSLACSSFEDGLSGFGSTQYSTLSVHSDAYWMSRGESRVAAIRSENGSIECFSTGENACNGVPAGAFVHLRLQNNGGTALEADGTVVNWNEAGVTTTSTGEVFQVYQDSFGIRADGTIGVWTDASQLVAAGQFALVVDDVANVVDPASGLAATGCGLRPTGELVCWHGTDSVLTEFSPLPGLFENIASSWGILYVSSAEGVVYTLGATTAPDSAVLDYVNSGQVGCWLNLAGELYCGGTGETPDWMIAGDYPEAQVFEELSASLGSPGNTDFLVKDSNGIQHFGSNTSGIAALDLSVYDTIDADISGEDYLLCGFLRSDASVSCSRTGTNIFGGSSHVSPSTTVAPALDVTVGEFTGCRILADGELDCWGYPFTPTPHPAGPFLDVEINGYSDIYVLQSFGAVRRLNTSGSAAETLATGAQSLHLPTATGTPCWVNNDGTAGCSGTNYSVVRSW